MIKAKTKYTKSAPRKIARVLDVVRGKKALDAVVMLKFMPQKAARIVEKVVRSAIANAKHNQKLNEADLFIKECYVNKGTDLKRIQPRARGRAFAILKRTSHVTVCLGGK